MPGGVEICNKCYLDSFHKISFIDSVARILRNNDVCLFIRAAGLKPVSLTRGEKKGALVRR
jgi:hypothetical protein